MLDDARRYADEAVERDPLMWFSSLGTMLVDLFGGRFEAAVAWCDDAVKRFGSEAPLALWWRGNALAFSGREAEAIAVFERHAAVEGELFADICELEARAFRGDRDATCQWLEHHPRLKDAALTDEAYSMILATSFARVEDFDAALHWLDTSISFGFTNHRFLSEHNRFLVPLRGDPRFEALMDKARERQRAFEM